jgi:hypothetical protein
MLKCYLDKKYLTVFRSVRQLVTDVDYDEIAAPTGSWYIRRPCLSIDHGPREAPSSQPS